ncbi:alpha/beta hydrolase [Agaribacter marinus]|uniref:Esterase n=1 Tax=Agaribacter marinus TaxID=1431249 RepID=A0AA37WLI9_9ALTE|nr:alpha/beta hydrolase-fold protein [Agaribacter marinus]GLR72200.1 esterase [Agaribacter marinus]
MKLSFVRRVALFLLLYTGVSKAFLAESDGFQIVNSKVVTIDSTVLGRKYDLFIKLPHDYFWEKSRLKKYPVLYLNDGPHTFKVAAGVTHFREMDRVIVVGVSFAHGENGQYSRVRDLTPVVDDTWTKYKTGGAPSYLEFFEDEVISYIEDNYRANSDQRILSGHSLGGSFGTWVLLTKPDLFSNYILTSPSLWYKNNWIFDVEKKFFSKSKLLDANVYFATGALETLKHGMRHNMVNGQVKFVKQLRSRDYQGLTLEEDVVNGTDHYSTYPVGLSKGLMFIYKQLSLP